MKAAIAVVACAGCIGGELRFDPPAIELTVQLDAPASAALRVLEDDLDVTSRVTFRIEGAPLGRVDAAS